MNPESDHVEVFYLDDMEDEIIITEMNFRRQKLKLNLKFFLDEHDMLADLHERFKAPQGPPSLIVTDLNMPGRGGVGLVHGLRSDDRFQEITIGVCTGSDNPADHAAALAAGADFTAVKPFDRKALAHICETTGRFTLIRGDDGMERLSRHEAPTRN